MERKKYSKEELYKMDAVEIYKLVLEGKYLKRFPNGFWVRPDAYDNAKKCFKWLIEDYLKLTDEQIKNLYNRQLISDYKLAGMVACCFEGSVYKTIEFVYPGRFYPWEFKVATNGTWKNIDNGIMAVKWLIETKLNYTDEDILNKLTIKIFREYGLEGMIQHCFNSSVYKAVSAAYPGRFYPWEFKITAAGIWKDKNNAIMSVKWLIEEKLGYTQEDVRQKLSTKAFIDNGLLGMLLCCFDGSVYKALNTTYPGVYKKEDLQSYTFYPGMYEKNA